MNKIAIACFATFACLALPGCNSATVASAPTAKSTTGRNPMQASASYNVAQAQAATVGGGYDSDCRTKFPSGSTEYTNCLQHLPAGALVGGGR